ncbi:MAG: SDR family oxidoreductase [Gemmatimonadota bacterium]
MSTILFTGFPGFLGSALLPVVAERRPGSQVVCLVQARYRRKAEARVNEILAGRSHLTGRIRLVESDIVQADLGLESGGFRREVREIYHLAALYDLAADRDPAFRINVEGTRSLLRLAHACPALRRFHYLSTCYVSGRYRGTFSEADLDVGQAFHNAYEETKFLAEVEVQAHMREGLPATIYRPSVVAGDSATGSTQKYDGPYYLIRLLLRQPRLALVPVIGDPSQHWLNIVPRDFLVAAIGQLAGLERSAGRVYQLADPAPLLISQLFALLGRETGRRLVPVRLPLGVARGLLVYLPGLSSALGIPANALDYLVHPARYDTRNARRDLEGSGLRVPPFSEYAGHLVRFVREHPEISAEAMA